MVQKRTKDFAREAKSRMTSERNRGSYQSHNYVLNEHLLSEEEVDEIYRRMVQWMDVSPFDILSRLRDREEWEKLSGADKEKYVLQLAGIYHTLRNDYERKRKAQI